MKWRTIVKAAVFLINPFKNISHFVQITNLLESIYIYKIKKVIRVFQLVIIVLILKNIHLIYLALDGSQTDYIRTLHFDAHYTLIPQPAFRFLCAMLNSLNIYNYYVFANILDYKLMILLKNVVTLRDAAFFSKVSTKENLKQCIKTRKFFQISLRLFENITLSTGK